MYRRWQGIEVFTRFIEVFGTHVKLFVFTAFRSVWRDRVRKKNLTTTSSSVFANVSKVYRSFFLLVFLGYDVLEWQRRARSCVLGRYTRRRSNYRRLLRLPLEIVWKLLTPAVSVGTFDGSIRISFKLYQINWLSCENYDVIGIYRYLSFWRVVEVNRIDSTPNQLVVLWN